MNGRDERILPYVVERDMDMVFIQLIQTSHQFRGWFLKQLDVDETETEFIGIRHSVMRDAGESDVEIELETADGNRLIVLVENKINAAKQERQAERYFERGRNYVNEDVYDEFTVCLIAPEHYIGESETRSFGNVVTYEDILRRVGKLDHDGKSFFREVIEEGIEKRSLTNHSELTAAIREQLITKFEQLPDVDFLSVSNTLVKVKSNDPKHPSTVIYVVYLPGGYDGKKAEVRVEILGEASEEEQKIIQSVLANHVDGLEEYRFKNRIMDPVRTDIHADDHDEAYIDIIVSEISELIDFYHPILVENVNTDNRKSNK